MRPVYGDAFEFDRIASTFFYTSSTEKLLQARILFSRNGYDLRHYSLSREPYEEDYSGGTHHLLSRAIRQLSVDMGLRRFFFIEDTSVRIEGLSGVEDFPGMRVKEWFRDTSFAEAYDAVRSRGTDMSVEVKSDIALHIPNLSRPIFFHGATKGQLANSPPEFSANEQYPWLTPDTFNGWFVPEGSSKRLGEMEFEESLEYDFRAKSIQDLILRLEEINAGLNLRPQYYTSRKLDRSDSQQLQLLPKDNGGVIVVIGHKCAGKTTLCDHLSSKGGVTLFEASSVLRRIADEYGETITNSDAAMDFLLKKGLAIVGEKIAGYIDHAGADLNVISGLRTVEELVAVVSEYPQTQIVLVECDPRIRFERHIRRSRDQQVKTYGQFLEMDRMQERFGIMQAARALATVTIVNESTLANFAARVDEVMTMISSGSLGRAEEARSSELARCVRALSRLGRAATCEEISDESASEGRVRKYNTNRALRETPEFARRIEARGELLRYELTERGKVLATLFDLI